ncbi:MAG: RNA methyltransferase [Acidimicrobiia bacterium]|nr:RNA methyltransferase [Acidimicrobiia bacterium]
MASAGIGRSLEGFHAVRAAIDAGRVTSLTVEISRTNRADYAALLANARSAGVVIEEVDDVRDRATTGAPQGLVAAARPLPLVPLEAAVAANEPAALLVLDHLEDPRNVGAIARSMLAAGVKGLVIPERRSASLEATAFKAAAGAFEELAVARAKSTADAMRRLRKLGVWLVGLDAAGERSLFGCDLLAEPVAIVVGAEGKGLSRLASDLLDVTVSIPIAPEVESLNASVAASLALFEVSRIRSTTLGAPLQ